MRESLKYEVTYHKFDHSFLLVPLFLPTHFSLIVHPVYNILLSFYLPLTPFLHIIVLLL